MSELDPALQSAIRLRLATMLTGASEIEFATIREHLEVSDSVLSKHVSALATVGYVKNRKSSAGGRRTTWISLTARGRKALQAHVDALRALIAQVDTAPDS